MRKVRIVKIVSNQYTVEYDDKTREVAIAMGKLRLDKTPIVGDFAQVEILEEKVVIQKILERRNQLKRPVLANVDQALIMMSAMKPRFASGLVDRLIFQVSLVGLEAVLFVTKMDLVDQDDELHQILDDYRKSGYLVIEISKDQPLPDLDEVFKGKVSVLMGNTGVGKSTLLNRIDKDLNIHTQEISESLGRGKHTTTYTELHALKGGLIADTPGFSSLDFSMVDPFELSRSIKDFQIGEECRFRNCMHLKEPGCVIKEAVNDKRISAIRYQNYCEVIETIEKEKK